MKRLVIPAFVALAVLAVSGAPARANGTFGFGFGFGIGLSFSGSAWSSSGCNSCSPCCKPAGPTCCGGIPAGGVPGCGLAVGAPPWSPPATSYNGYGYDPQKAALAWQAPAYYGQLAYGYPAYNYPAYGYPAYGYYPAPAPVPQAPAANGTSALANAR